MGLRRSGTEGGEEGVKGGRVAGALDDVAETLPAVGVEGDDGAAREGGVGVVAKAGGTEEPEEPRGRQELEEPRAAKTEGGEELAARVKDDREGGLEGPDGLAEVIQRAEADADGGKAARGDLASDGADPRELLAAEDAAEMPDEDDDDGATNDLAERPGRAGRLHHLRRRDAPHQPHLPFLRLNIQARARRERAFLHHRTTAERRPQEWAPSPCPARPDPC
jgi:hypothetical protein